MPDKYPSPDAADKDAYMRELRQTLGDLERLLKEEPEPSRPLTGRGRALARQPVVLGGEDSQDLQLLMRFITGALILGAEELVAKARRWEQEAPDDDMPLSRGQALEEAGYLALARYWTIGMLSEGRRSAVGALRRTLGTPAGLTPSLMGLSERLTAPFFMRPLRRPLARMISYAEDTSKEWIADGWREEQIGRWIALNGAQEILADVIHIISANPELAELVRDQLSQQSMGMAASVVESGRKLSAVGDDFAEAFARRLFRRGLRVEVPRVEPKPELPPEFATKEGPNNGD